MALEVEVFSQQKSKISPAFFRRVCLKVSRKLGWLSRRKISLVFVGEKTLRRLNQQYRHKDKTSSILSFVFREKNNFLPITDQEILGEILICPGQARKEAAREGICYQEKILRLFIHGLLHLLGHTHENQRQRKIMEAKEEELINLVS